MEGRDFFIDVWFVFNTAILSASMVAFWMLLKEQRSYPKPPSHTILDLLPWLQQTARGRKLAYLTCLLLPLTFGSFLGFFEFTSDESLLDFIQRGAEEHPFTRARTDPPTVPAQN